MMGSTKPSIAVVLAGSLAATAAAQQPADLEVKRVAVFSSGVAFFECGAKVAGDATGELKFRTDQINDILKSLVVEDLDGGTIGAVGYASRDPVEKTLRSFGVDLTGKPTLAQLLDQLRGEPIEIAAPRQLKGTIVGVEKLRMAAKDLVIEYDVLNVLTPGGLEQITLGEAKGIKLTNEKIDGELRQALATLATGHDADKKTVVLHFSGKGERRVRASYLLEAPIWKTSYRLVLTEKDKPFLQGWATVENATERDWTDVRLSLVSGRPISFTMDLYTPLYVPRPKEELELYASLRPPEFEGRVEMALQPEDKKRLQALGYVGAEAKKAVPAAPTRGRGRMAGVGGKMVMEADALAGEPPAPMAMAGAGVESVATAQEAGELFEYVIRTPVSVGRQHSAMLPIANEQIEGTKVSVFNPATHAKYPLNGLEIKNTTGLHLMQGPVTVFDANVYAGDAKLPDLKPDEKRLVAYALDLAVEVMTKQESVPEQLVSVRIAKGTLWRRNKLVDEREYVVKNKDRKDRTLLLEQAYSDDWKLIEPKEPYERTQNLLRFKVPVAGQKTISQRVRLERTLDQSVGLTDAGLDQIRVYLQSKVISPAVKQALEKVIELRDARDDTVKRWNDAQKELHDTTEEQGRVRENLKTLPQNTDQYQRQLKKFDTLETQIEQVKGRLAELQVEMDAKRKVLESYLLSLDIE